MEISQEHKHQIDKIMNEMDCQKDFECHKSSFENIGKTWLITGDHLVECPEGNKQKCSYALPFGHMLLCKCPLRNYVAQNLKG